MYTDLDLDRFIKTYVTKRQESLLQSDLEKYHIELKKQICGKKMLVIGGAGTIGSSYIKAILKFNVSRLVVVDINENGLTELVRDLRSSTGYNIPADFITYPMNFGDRVFEKMFRSLAPFDIVANFAAHKHVRSEKDVFSIEAMIENNVLRARKILDLLLEYLPEHFFCVSTDKAANPVNIMGASKKLMEDLIMAYSDRLPITTARFANVAFSNGSLPLGFIERLNKRQPWSCPIGIRRFFVSPQESGELCMIASVLGESGDIIFPKLDEKRDMISFDAIALDLLKYLDLKADFCKTEEEARQKALLFNENSSSYPVYFFETDTSGEKPYEEFFTEKEVIDNERFLNLGVIKNSVKKDIGEIDEIFSKLKQIFTSDHVSKADIVETLKEWLPNFEHIEKGKGLGFQDVSMYQKFFKRFFDIILSFIALVILSPVLIPVVIGLLLTGEHYVFYFQKRIGYKNKPFNIWKFATMLKASPSLPGGLHTTRKDPRLMPLGGFLRKTKINEIPQLVNILIGDMSIVGPRPLVDKTFDPYPEHVKADIYNVRPGLTGIGSIVFRDEERLLSETKLDPKDLYAASIAPFKGELELWYQDHLTFYTDFMLVFMTAWAILFPKTELVFGIFRNLPKKPEFLR